MEAGPAPRPFSFKGQGDDSPDTGPHTLGWTDGVYLTSVCRPTCIQLHVTLVWIVASTKTQPTFGREIWTSCIFGPAILFLNRSSTRPSCVSSIQHPNLLKWLPLPPMGESRETTELGLPHLPCAFGSAAYLEAYFAPFYNYVPPFITLYGCNMQ